MSSVSSFEEIEMISDFKKELESFALSPKAIYQQYCFPCMHDEYTLNDSIYLRVFDFTFVLPATHTFDDLWNIAADQFGFLRHYINDHNFQKYLEFFSRFCPNFKLMLDFGDGEVIVRIVHNSASRVFEEHSYETFSTSGYSIGEAVKVTLQAFFNSETFRLISKSEI